MENQVEIGKIKAAIQKLMSNDEGKDVRERIKNLKALFGCSRIHINPHVLGWVGVELKLNSTPIHSNTCGLR